ncbi:MAG: hypothetical protein AAGH83_05425 [Pseudomonadota bacterium]
MLDTEMAARLEDVRLGNYSDPRPVYDLLSKLMWELKNNQAGIPVELRRIVEDLEAEIAEEYYNNIPV